MGFMESYSSFPLESFAEKSVFNHQLIIYREGVRLGEWSEDEVRKLHAEGLLHLSDFYWRQGMKEWAPLQSLLTPQLKQNIFSKYG
jgi:hypothetical protein